jgi:hypothetical protein
MFVLRSASVALVALVALAATATSPAQARLLCDGPCPKVQPKPKPKPKPPAPRGGRIGCDDCSTRPAKPKPKPPAPRGGRIGCDDCSTRPAKPKPKPKPPAPRGGRIGCDDCQTKPPPATPKWVPPAKTFFEPALARHRRLPGPCVGTYASNRGFHNANPASWHGPRTALREEEHGSIVLEVFNEVGVMRYRRSVECRNGAYLLVDYPVLYVHREVWLEFSCGEGGCRIPLWVNPSDPWRKGPWKPGWK